MSTVVYKLQVEGFGEAKQDLEFLTTETKKLNVEKGRMATQHKAAARAITAEAGSIEELRAETALLRQQANQMRVTNEKEARARDQVIRKVNENTIAIRNHDRAMSGSNTLVGEYSRGIEGSFKKIGMATASLVAGFAALRGGIKLFTGIMNSADSSGTALEATMAGMKGGVDNFFKSIATGDWSSFLSNLGNAIKAGREFVEIMDALQDRTRAFSIAEADLKSELSDLEQIIKDTSDESEAGFLKRAEAAEEYLAKTEAFYTKRQVLANDNFAAYENKISAMSQLTTEQLNDFLRQEDGTMELMKIGQQYLDITKEMKKATDSGLTDAYLAARERRTLLGSEAQLYGEIVKDWNKLNDDEKDTYVDLYAKKKEAEYAWFTESKRIYTQYGALLVRAGKEEVKEAGELKKIEKAALDAAKALKALEEGHFNYVRALSELEYRFDPEAVQQVAVEPIFTEEEWAEGMAKSREAFAKVQEENKKRRAEQDKEDFDAAEEQADKKRDIAVAAMRGVEMAADTIFEGKKQRLNAEMEAELSNQNLTERQRAAIIKKYAREQQKIDIKQALINTALAIGNAIATTKPFMPAGLIAGALAALQGGFQVAAIKSQKFAHSGLITKGVHVRPDRNGDDTLIVAKRGEVVLNQKHQALLGGASTFRRIGVPGFAEGGMVGNIPQSQGVAVDMTGFVDKIIEGFNDKKVVLSLPELKTAEKTFDLVTKSSEL